MVLDLIDISDRITRGSSALMTPTPYREAQLRESFEQIPSHDRRRARGCIAARNWEQHCFLFGFGASAMTTTSHNAAEEQI